jgi:LuxR family transcriptional regulator, maltose regulon positive regulatory protein
MDRVSHASGDVHKNAVVVVQHGGRRVPIPVGAPDWYTWLATATAFSFKSEEGSFTAHKTRASNGRGGWYWYASRRRRGHLTTIYLGTSQNLTPFRLQEAARTLAERAEKAVTEQSSTRQRKAPSAHSPFPTEVLPMSSGSLLATKLHIPRLPVQHIVRPHLLALLEEGVQRPVTLVSAPAGSGKTTLLAEWARATKRQVAWLSLEQTENDCSRFLSYLLGALARQEGHLDSSVQNDHSWQMPDHERVLTGLLNELERVLEQDVVLILDDTHLLTSEAVQAALLFLLEHLPARLHLVIGTRVDPPLPLARLRAHHQVGELRTAELRFLSSEVEAFAHAMGLTLSEEAAHLLEERTEGWIAGIQVLALALHGKGDAAAFLSASGGTHHVLLDYVREEVLAQQPPELQRFLLRTCILERMSGPLCDAVTREPGGKNRLAVVLRANLFVSALDDTQTWYRYHPLFAEVLRAELQKREPALVPELYRRASCWYEEHQSTEEACAYASLSGDLPRAAHLLAGQVPRLMQQGRVEQMGRWLEQLPPAAIAASPELAIASRWMQYLRTSAREHLEMLAEHMEHSLKEQPHEVVVSWVELQSELTLHQAFVAFDQHDVVGARTLLHGALRSLSAQESALSCLMALRLKMMLSLTYRASGDLAAAQQVLLDTCMPQAADFSDLLNLAATWCLARLYEAQGLLRKRGALYERLFQTLRPDTALAPLPLVLVQGSRAALFYEWNQVPEASHVVQQVLTLGERMEPTDFSGVSASSRWIQTRIALAQGQVDAVREILEHKGQPPVQIPIVEREEPPWAAIHARLALALGRMGEAWQWACTCGKRFDDRPGPDLSGAGYFEYMTLARILIARGRLQHTRAALAQALTLLTYLCDLVVQMGLSGWFLEIQILKALALQAQSKIRQALTTLGVVLTQAEPEGYVRLFADEGLPMAHLLAQVSLFTTASLGYLQHLQAATASMQPALLEDAPSKRNQPIPHPLSAREHEVLQLVVEGASNQQIADRLVIGRFSFFPGFSIQTLRTGVGW